MTTISKRGSGVLRRTFFQSSPLRTSFAAMLLLCAAMPVPAVDDELKPRVGVATFADDTGEASTGLVCRAATDTLELTLRLMGSWRVEHVDAPDTSVAALAALAEAGGYDSIIVGSVGARPGRGYALRARLFDRASGTFTIEDDETADSVLDVFDAADRLVTGFLEAMAGVHLGFGRIEFVNQGEPGAYLVRIDGEPAGWNPTSLDRVLNGAHVVTVHQDRMHGGFELARAECLMLEGGEVAVRFSVPYELPAEREWIDALLARVERCVEDPGAANDAGAALGELSVLLASTAYSPRLAGRLSEGVALRPFLDSARFRQAVEAAALEPLLVDAGRPAAILAANEDHPRVAELRAVLSESACILARLLDMEAARAADRRAWAKAGDAYARIAALAPALPEAERAYYGERADILAAAVSSLSAGALRGNAAAPWLLGAGLLLAGGGAAIFALDADGDAAARGASLYLEYLAAETVDAAQALHERVAAAYTAANVFAIGKWAGTVAGGGLSALGLVGTLAGNGQGQFRSFMKAFFADALDAAQRFEMLRESGAVALSIAGLPTTAEGGSNRAGGLVYEAPAIAEALNARILGRARALPKWLALDAPRLEMVTVPGGTFGMAEAGSAEPVHAVTLSPFRMSACEITQARFQAVMGYNPSAFSKAANAAAMPVENVSWFEAVEFCNRLSLLEGLEPYYRIERRIPARGHPVKSAEVSIVPGADGYRLPTEAQWDYAAKGSPAGDFWTSMDPARAMDYAWFFTGDLAYKPKGTSEVDMRLPDSLGFYDILGNVSEWCQDWYGVYDESERTDPTGAESGTYRIYRGGGWTSVGLPPAGQRYGADPAAASHDLGFRVVRAAP